jgi:hypothetical protein
MVGVDPYGTATLGCARTKGVLDNQFDEYSFTLVTACFADQCPSPPVSTPTKQRNPGLTCQKLCQDGEASCLRYKIVSTNSAQEAQLAAALDHFNNAMYMASPPTKVDVSGLVTLSNLFTGKQTCSRGTLDIADPPSPYPFANSGATCPVGFAISRPDVSAVEIDWPGLYQGKIQINPATTSYAMASDAASSPSLFVTETATKKPVLEPVITVQGTHGPTSSLVFTGQQYYCAEIDWDSK